MRTFIALEIPDGPKQQLTEYLNLWSKAHPQGISWVRPENLHLTLLFIGETDPALIPSITKQLGSVCDKLSPFRMNFLGCELFPAINPRLLWVKLNAENKDIFGVPKLLLNKLKVFGLDPELKALKLHITLGRIKSPQAAWIEREFLQANLNTESYFYDTVSLYKSTLKPEGPVYTLLEQFFLV